LNDSVFSKTVICILDHHQPGTMDNEIILNSCTSNNNDADNDQEESDHDKIQHHPNADPSATNSTTKEYRIPGQIYGLIINQVSIREETGHIRTLDQVFRENGFPEQLSECFGKTTVRFGGPVHPTLQMIHCLSPTQRQQQQHRQQQQEEGEEEEKGHDVSSSSSALAIGGTLIPEFVDTESAALYSDRATYFRGNIMHAKRAVLMIETGAPYMGFDNCRQHYLQHNQEYIRTSLNSKQRKRLQQSIYPNVPSSLTLILQRVTECLQQYNPSLTIEKVAAATTHNAQSFFGLSV
jgi:hypothetical protein